MSEINLIFLLFSGQELDILLEPASQLQVQHSTKFLFWTYYAYKALFEEIKFVL